MYSEAAFDQHGSILWVVSDPQARAKELIPRSAQYDVISFYEDAPDPGGYYVSDGQVVEKQPLNLPESLQITADGIDEAVISNIPAGATVQWPDGQIDEVPDGEVCFAVDLPGTYTLTFDAVPYLRQEVTIEAVAAT